jgi:hypothetical protein
MSFVQARPMVAAELQLQASQKPPVQSVLRAAAIPKVSIARRPLQVLQYIVPWCCEQARALQNVPLARQVAEALDRPVPRPQQFENSRCL